jgi:hypothetical protein
MYTAKHVRLSLSFRGTATTRDEERPPAQSHRRREDSRLKFRLEEIDGEPHAVVEGVGATEETLLRHFLLPAPHFVPDVLYEISLIERRAVESSGFETALVDVRLLTDRVVIKSKIRDEGEGEESEAVIPLDEAKLALLEWGAALQRWRMEREKGS